VVDRVWYHSNPTSKGHPRCQVHMSTPLLTLSLHYVPVASRLSPTSTETLLSLLQLLKQTEVSRDLGAHCCGCYVMLWSLGERRVRWDEPRYRVSAEEVDCSEIKCCSQVCMWELDSVTLAELKSR
jgi:hypothetical protein